MAKSRIRRQIAETGGDGDPELGREQLSALEDEWMASRVQGDLEFSDRLIHDSYRGFTSDGRPQSKSEFMQSIARSAPSHSGAEHAERNIEIHGGVAISSGIATMHSAERAHSFRYMRIFLNREGTWRLIASQSTRVREG